MGVFEESSEIYSRYYEIFFKFLLQFWENLMLTLDIPEFMIKSKKWSFETYTKFSKVYDREQKKSLKRIWREF